MYFSDGDIKQMAWTIVTSIGERMMEEDDVLSSKQYHVGWFYTGFGLYIRIPSTTNAECAAISYNGGTVFCRDMEHSSMGNGKIYFMNLA